MINNNNNKAEYGDLGEITEAMAESCSENQ